MARTADVLAEALAAAPEVTTFEHDLPLIGYSGVDLTGYEPASGAAATRGAWVPEDIRAAPVTRYKPVTFRPVREIPRPSVASLRRRPRPRPTVRARARRLSCNSRTRGSRRVTSRSAGGGSSGDPDDSEPPGLTARGRSAQRGVRR